MTEFVMNNEVPIRLGIFFGVLLVFALWELVAPRRKLTVSKRLRWVNNLGIVFLNSLILRLVLPVAAVGIAVLSAENGWGLFNNVRVPYAVVVILSVIALDLTIYLQHVMVHAIPLMWRLHRMHHADLDFDVTTGARFHPLEILLSMFIKFAAILLIGPPVVAVVLFEVLLNATAMFNHSNIRLPLGLDRLLRWLVVTPDMHRVHHSVIPNEANSNFGFNLPWWDRLFGTYRAQPEAGHEAMTIGITQFREPKYLRLDFMVIQPFLGKARGYPINAKENSLNDRAADGDAEG